MNSWFEKNILFYYLNFRYYLTCNSRGAWHTQSCSPRIIRGWSGGAMVLGKLPVPGRPTNFDYSRARAYCTCSRCGWGCLDIFSLIYLFSFLSPSLWETARYRLKYSLKGPLSPKQPTNQSNHKGDDAIDLLSCHVCHAPL